MGMDTIEINGITLRVKEVRATEMMAFLTIYGKAVKEEDFISLEKSYDQLLSWIEADINGSWVKIYDRQTRKCVVIALVEEFKQSNFILKLMPLIQPFMQSSAE